MRLTQFLKVIFPKKQQVNGLTYKGKNPKRVPIKTSQKIGAVNKIMRAEQNMIYISNPYLSNAEEQVYGRDHLEDIKSKRKKKFLDSKRKPFFPDRTIEEHFRDTVYTQKKWE